MKPIYTIPLSIIVLNQTMLLAENSNSRLDDFYKKAFGKESTSKSDIFLPLVINGKIHTEVFIRKEGQKIYIKESGVNYLIGLLKPEYKKFFVYKLNQSGFVSKNKIEKEGITIAFNEDKVQLEVIIPPKLKKAQEINMHRNYLKHNGKITKREKVAGGLNIYFNQSYYEQEDSFERLPLTGSGDLFLNVQDFVIEGEVYYDEDHKDRFRRGRVVLTKDDEDRQLRYRVGDIYLPQLNRMTKRESLGVSVEKIFDMDENFFKNVSRINSYEFFLANRSRVEIYINNRYIRQLNLDAGTHNLYDLNIPTGLSRVKLTVIEEGGKTEYIEFNDFDYSELYKEGVSRYGIGIGIESKRDNNDKIEYEQDKEFAALYGEYGVNSFLTLKVSSEFSKEYQSYMVEPIIGTPIGLFDVYVIESNKKEENKNGAKYGLNYRTNIGSVNLSLSAEETQKDFTTNTSYSDTNQTLSSTIYRGRVYTPFLYHSQLSFGVSKYRDEEKKKEEYSIDLRKQITSNFDLLLSYDYNKDITNHDNEYEVYLTLNYRFGNTNAQYSEYLKEKKHMLSLSNRPERYYGVTTNIDLEDNPSAKRASARANIKDEKFRLSTNYIYRNNKNSSNNNQYISTQFATGVYFAGDTFSISEPIDTSYIIVENSEKLKESPLGIVGYQDNEDKSYSSFVIRQTNHRGKKMVVNELNLPMGIELVDTEQYFKSNYKSGSVMKIDVESFYSIKGKLVDSNKSPIKLRAFKVYNTETGEKEISFTDEKGEFLLGNIQSGTYNAVLFRTKDDNDITQFSFSIQEKDSIEHIIDIGEIKIELAPKSILNGNYK